MMSFDEESLFTNVPVLTTGNTIIDSVSNHPTFQPPCISTDVLHQLLKVCTTKTSFPLLAQSTRSETASRWDHRLASLMLTFIWLTSKIICYLIIELHIKTYSIIKKFLHFPSLQSPFKWAFSAGKSPPLPNIVGHFNTEGNIWIHWAITWD